jgi:UTP-glucose-1-phosphate uridylyltransferase
MPQTLVVLAAGLSTRYGGNKQLASVGPNDEVLLDYAVYDAMRAGFTNVTFVIRRELEQEFRMHVTRRFGRRVQITFAYQELKDLPEGIELPVGRVKPWGTAHAILAARAIVTGPFVVINADDFYGAAAYSLLSEFLERTQASGTPEFGMTGYILHETFSPFGGVSRGICECDNRGFLERIVEVKNIVNNDGEIAGVTVSGDGCTLQGDETVSMNIWALTPDVFPILERQFVGFLSEYREDPDAEFLISSALNEQIASDVSQLRVLTTRDRWFGMTFQADRQNVARQIMTLVEQGVYPDDLTSWFQENR